MKIVERIKENKPFTVVLFLSTFIFIFTIIIFVISNVTRNADLVSVESVRVQEHYESVLHEIFAKLETIEVFTETVGVDNLNQTNFDEFGDNSDFSNIGFVSFSIAPAGILEYYYSYDYDDDDIIGLDLVNDDRENVKEAVAYAIENDVVVISGPFTLIQGGQGLVFRKAVYEDGEFVAIINLVINYDNLNLLFGISKSEVVDVGIFNAENELLFGDLEYSDDLAYYEGIGFENVNWNTGIEVSRSFRFQTRLSNLSILFLAVALYFTVLVLGVKFYRGNRNLLITQNELINYDNLTSLPNRRLLSRDVKNAMILNEPFHLGFGDLDNFKNLNDILGHSVGDKYLKDISKRFKTLVSDKLKIYRWGGDEFIFLMRTKTKEDSIVIINSIYDVFKEPITINETNYYVSITIGIVNFPNHGNTMDDLIKRADIVMYDVKSERKNTFRFFENKYLDNLKREVDFENKVNEYSLSDFEVFLQPVLHTNTQEVYGFEGLIRLFDENKNLINTHEIVKVYERKGDIYKLDTYVFEEVCKHSIKIKEEFNKNFSFSFNISPITLSRDFVIFVKEMIDKYKIDSSYFIIEIIETLGFKDIDVSLNLLGELKDLGFRIAMDDFGMGYSSLSYITRLPLSIIKIDRHFVHNYKTNDFDRMLMLTIKDISKSLDIKIIVEGIETKEQLKFITEMGAHYFQGYLHSKAMRVTDVIKLMKED